MPPAVGQIVPLTDCLLASEQANEARERIVDWCWLQSLTVYDRRANSGVLRNLVVREGRRTGQIQARLVTARGATIDRDSLVAAAGRLDGMLWTRQSGRGGNDDGRGDRAAGGI